MSARSSFHVGGMLRAAVVLTLFAGGVLHKRLPPSKSKMDWFREPVKMD